MQETILKDMLTAIKENKGTFKDSGEAEQMALAQLLMIAYPSYIRESGENISCREFAEMFLGMSQKEREKYVDSAYRGTEGTMTEADKKELEKLNYRKTVNAVMPITKVMDNFFGQGKNDTALEPFDVRVSARNAKKEAYLKDCQLVILPDMADGFKLSTTLSPFDREVLNGVCSILESGQNVMTSRMIAEAMSGKKQNSPQAIGAITKSMNRLRTTLVSFDWTEHANMKQLGKGKFDTVVQSENAIYAESVEVSANGYKETAYRIMKEPALLSYAKSVGQIVTVKKELLNAPVGNTQKNIVLKNILLRRIERMKGKPQPSKADLTIRFDTLFKQCGIEEGTRNETKRNRDTVFTLLRFFIEKAYITGYMEKKEKKAIVAVEIAL